MLISSDSCFGVTLCGIDQDYIYIFGDNFISFRKDRMSSMLTLSN